MHDSLCMSSRDFFLEEYVDRGILGYDWKENLPFFWKGQATDFILSWFIDGLLACLKIVASDKSGTKAQDFVSVVKVEETIFA